MEFQQQQMQLQHKQFQSLLASRPASTFRLPDPPRFDGKPYNLRTWQPAVQAKLRAEGLTGQPAFDYIFDRLKPSQQASVLHLRQAQELDPESIFQYFQRLCHNLRQKQEAVLRFSSIRQRDEESLVAYLARFERLAFEADVNIQISEFSLFSITTFHRGLRQSLRQSLEQSEDSLFDLAYTEYVELVQRYERRQRQPPVHQSRPAQHGEPIEISVV